MTTETKRQVQYGFDVQDSIPQSDGRQPSALEQSLQRIKTEVPPGKPVIVAKYQGRTAASGAATQLRIKHGGPEVEGFKFDTVRQGDTSSLVVTHDPKLVKPEAKAAHEQKLAAHKAKLAEQAKARLAKKAAEGKAPAAPKK